ncbi:MAG: tetratricopeptide repeat protein [Gammaproteobacteria bacterium]
MSRIVNLALNAADHLVGKKRLDAAASILRNYLSTNQPDPQVLQRLGRIYLAQGRSAEAIPLLQQALDCFVEPSSTAQSIQTDRAVSNMVSSESAATEPAFDSSSTRTDIDPLFIPTH